jgi:hypothetical protein
MSDITVNDVQMTPVNADELTEDINAPEGGGGGGITIPDYTNMDQTNHISANPGTWTVDRDGYVLLRCDRSNSNGYNHWRINGIIVASIWLSGDRTMSVLPVKKGDVISLEGGNSTEVMCFYIPPVRIEQSPVSINAIGPPDYKNEETTNRITSNGGSWTADRDGYVRCSMSMRLNSYGTAYVQINGRQVASSSDESSSWCSVAALVAVNKGDVVTLIGSNSPTSVTTQCFFIPPKFASIFFNHVNFAFDTGRIGTAMRNEDTKEIAITGEYGYCEGDGNRYLLTRPDTWPVGMEINFSGGLFGRRCTGTITAAANASVETVAFNNINGKAVSFGGWLFDASSYLAMPYANPASGTKCGILFRSTTLDCRIISQSGASRTDAPYDVWITYTKQ